MKIPASFRGVDIGLKDMPFDDIVWKMAVKVYEDEKEKIFDVKYKRCIVNAENDDKNKCINIKIVFLYKD